MCHPAVFIGLTAMQVMEGQAQIKALKARERLNNAILDQEERDRLLEFQRKENDRKEAYLRDQARNDAYAPAMGITGEGGSFKALARKNENIFKDDLQTFRFGKANMQQAITDRRALLKAQTKSAIRGVRMGQLQAIAFGAYSYNQAAAPSTTATGGNIGRTSMFDYSNRLRGAVPGDAGFAGSPNPRIGFRY